MSFEIAEQNSNHLMESRCDYSSVQGVTLFSYVPEQSNELGKIVNKMHIHWGPHLDTLFSRSGKGLRNLHSLKKIQQKFEEHFKEIIM